MENKKISGIQTGITLSGSVLLTISGLLALRQISCPGLFIRNCGIIYILLWISIHDIRTRRIPDRYIRAGLMLWLLGVIAAWDPPDLQNLPVQQFAFTARRLLCGAGISGMGILSSWLAARMSGRQGIGGGDLKLFFLAGAVLGWEKGIELLLLSCILGALTCLTQEFFGRMYGKSIPFGPAICLSFAFLLTGGI